MHLIDFDCFVTMIANLDNNSKEVKFFLDKSDFIYIGVLYIYI